MIFRPEQSRSVEARFRRPFSVSPNHGTGKLGTADLPSQHPLPRTVDHTRENSKGIRLAGSPNNEPDREGIKVYLNSSGERKPGSWEGRFYEVSGKGKRGRKFSNNEYHCRIPSFIITPRVED